MRVAVGLGVVAFGLAACAGADAPSKAQYARKANQICRDAEKRIERLGETSEPDELAGVIDDVIQETRATADELQDLDRPEGSAGETATKWVETLDKELEDDLIPAFERLRDAIEEKDQRAVQKAAAKLQALGNTDSDQYARELGARSCVG